MIDGNTNSDSVIGIALGGTALLLALLHVAVFLILCYAWRHGWLRRMSTPKQAGKQAQQPQQPAPQFQLMPYDGADNQQYFTIAPDTVNSMI